MILFSAFSAQAENWREEGRQLARTWLSDFDRIPPDHENERFQAARALIEQKTREFSTAPGMVSEPAAYALGEVWHALLSDSSVKVRAVGAGSVAFHLRWNRNGTGTFARALDEKGGPEKYAAANAAVSLVRPLLAEMVTQKPDPMDPYSHSCVEFSLNASIDLVRTYQGGRVGQLLGGGFWGANALPLPVHGGYPDSPHPHTQPTHDDPSLQILKELVLLEPWLGAASPTAEKENLARFERVLGHLETLLRGADPITRAAGVEGVRTLLAFGVADREVPLHTRTWERLRANRLDGFLKLLGEKYPRQLRRFAATVALAQSVSAPAVPAAAPGWLPQSGPPPSQPILRDALDAGGGSPEFLNALRAENDRLSATEPRARELSRQFALVSAWRGARTPAGRQQALATELAHADPERRRQALLFALGANPLQEWSNERHPLNPPTVADLSHEVLWLVDRAAENGTLPGEPERSALRQSRQRLATVPIDEIFASSTPLLQRQAAERALWGVPRPGTREVLLQLIDRPAGTIDERDRITAAQRLLVYFHRDAEVATRLQRAYIQGRLPEDWRTRNPEAMLTYHFSRLNSADPFEREEAWRVVPELLAPRDAAGKLNIDYAVARLLSIAPELNENRYANLKTAVWDRVAELWRTEPVYRDRLLRVLERDPAKPGLAVTIANVAPHHDDEARIAVRTAAWHCGYSEIGHTRPARFE